ncbi:MAG: hypothetical protein M1834_006281 [Cirrosporium novae-zelandiae]|nr:MAG: hypothetical protein M1834_006281 [Cirrosporium novae-zelandiae]
MSSSSQNRETGTVKGGTSTTPTPANNMGKPDEIGLFSSSPTSSRRRSSASSAGGMFSGLMSQKRDHENVTQMNTRSSMHDAEVKSGFFGTLWNSTMRGSGPNPNQGSQQQQKP